MILHDGISAKGLTLLKQGSCLRRQSFRCELVCQTGMAWCMIPNDTSKVLHRHIARGAVPLKTRIWFSYISVDLQAAQHIVNGNEGPSRGPG